MIFVIKDTNDKIKVERLYLEHKDRLFGVAYSILHDKSLAENAVHDTFVRIIEYLHKVDESNASKTITFLVIICKNIAINIYNSNKKSLKYEILDDEIDCMCSDNDNPLDIFITNESVRIIIDSMKQLKSIYQDVLLLKYDSHFNNEEIAHLLQISQATVRKRLERGKRMLIKFMEKDGVL